MADNPRIEALRRRVEKDPASIAFAQLAEEYRRAGEYGQAIKICREGLGRHPGYLSAQVTLGRALIELKHLDEARAELEAVLSVAPDNLAAIRALAEIHQQLDDEATAFAPPSDTALQTASRLDVPAVPTSELEPFFRQAAADAQASTPVANAFETSPPLDAEIDLPSIPDLSEWSDDAAFPMEAPALSPVAAGVDAPDPALEALEQWLAAIVADRSRWG